MALRKIHKDGEAVLKKKSKTVTKFDNRTSILIDDMIETLKDANGVGLAAPQVGILKRIIIIDAGEESGIVELVNPEIVESSGEQVYYEGCLSYPGYYGNVGRPESVMIRACDRNGESVAYSATGMFAVACCHEIDHLQGEMFMPKVKGPLYSLEEVKALREKAEADRAGSARGAKGSGSGGSGNGGSVGGGAPDDASAASAQEDNAESKTEGRMQRIAP